MKIELITPVTWQSIAHNMQEQYNVQYIIMKHGYDNVYKLVDALMTANIEAYIYQFGAAANHIEEFKKEYRFYYRKAPSKKIGREQLAKLWATVITNIDPTCHLEVGKWTVALGNAFITATELWIIMCESYLAGDMMYISSKDMLDKESEVYTNLILAAADVFKA